MNQLKKQRNPLSRHGRLNWTLYKEVIYRHMFYSLPPLKESAVPVKNGRGRFQREGRGKGNSNGFPAGIYRSFAPLWTLHEGTMPQWSPVRVWKNRTSAAAEDEKESGARRSHYVCGALLASLPDDVIEEGLPRLLTMNADLRMTWKRLQLGDF